MSHTGLWIGVAFGIAAVIIILATNLCFIGRQHHRNKQRKKLSTAPVSEPKESGLQDIQEKQELQPDDQTPRPFLNPPFGTADEDRYLDFLGAATRKRDSVLEGWKRWLVPETEGGDLGSGISGRRNTVVDVDSPRDQGIGMTGLTYVDSRLEQIYGRHLTPR